MPAAVDATRAGLPPGTSSDLARLYEQSAGAPVWLDADGRPMTAAAPGLALIHDAASEGLDPANYRAAELATLTAALDGSASKAAELDAGLSAAVLRYYRDVHLGRVDPRSLGLELTIPDDGHDFAAALSSAIEGGRVVETAAELAPQIAQYQLLKAALARYRTMAADAPVAPAFTATLRPGDTFDDLPALHRLLVATGDLPADTPVPLAGGVYDETMQVGVARFQARHGLDADSVIGAATQQALQVPLAWRVRQIELTLERLRWLPDLSSGRLIAVNIPMFRMFGWDSVPSADPPDLQMDVIVGRALSTRTPVFADRMEYMVFRPYWNIPTSILRNETIPAIRRNAAYLERQNMEIVAGPADGSPVLAPTPENIARIGQGGVRVRQLPGPTNALGLVKFMFPNDNNIYMHDTPSPQLFHRSRRDFSHGCIRVEDPVRLAEWVLKGDPAWTRDRIVAAMQQPRNNQRVNLPEPIQVVIYYTTAIVQPVDDAVHFAEDIYKHDGPLDKAL